MNPETKLTKKIVDHVRKSGNYCFKFHGNHLSEIGAPDLLCTIKSKFVGIEIKVNGNKPTKIQLEQIDRLNNWYNAKAFWVNEDNWKEKIEEVINELCL